MKYLILVVSLMFPMLSPAQNVTANDACAGVSEKCTADVTYDKTINGTIYSCYDCKQALCKDGGNGGLAGTKTSSVCTEKATTFQPIPIEDLFRGSDLLAPKPGPNPLPGGDYRLLRNTRDAKAAAESPVRDHRETDVASQAEADPGEIDAFDEADALFGRRTAVEPAQPDVTVRPAPAAPTPVPYPNTTAVVAHPERTSDAPRRKEAIPARRGTLPAPSNVTISVVGRTSLGIGWMDNAATEYGVSVERGTPIEARGGINYQWKPAFNIEERVMTRVQGTGWRTDEDDRLEPGTEYCYRLRAYHENQYSSYSPPTCARTSP